MEELQTWEDWNLRDELIDTQPILWAQAMLECAERVTYPDARDAILTRVGLVLYNRFGAAYDADCHRSAGMAVSRGPQGLTG
jgi:hypothetical protein